MRGKQRATEGETAERAARRIQRRDSLLSPPIPASSTIEANNDSTIGQSNAPRGGRARSAQLQVQIVVGNNTVNQIAAENSAPDASDMRAVNVQHPGHKRSRSNSSGTSARKRNQTQDQEQQQQVLAAEKELLPQQEDLGGWSLATLAGMLPGHVVRLKKLLDKARDQANSTTSGSYRQECHTPHMHTWSFKDSQWQQLGSGNSALACVMCIRPRCIGTLPCGWSIPFGMMSEARLRPNAGVDI